MQPVQPIAPPPVQPAQPMMQPQPTLQVPSPASAKKSKLPMIIIGVVLGLLAAVAIIGLVLYYSSPSSQSKRTSDRFMKAVTSGNISEATKLTGNTDAESQKFIKTASEATKGKYKFVASTGKEKKYYFLYTLSGGDQNYARTIVEQREGKWFVGSYVYGKDKLALIPGMTTTADNKVAIPAATGATSGMCLQDSDVAVLTGGQAYGTDMPDGYRVYVGDAVFFGANNTVYDFPDQVGTMLTQWGSFYSTNKGKEFTIHLKGKVHDSTNSAANDKLANDRAAKVKADMVAHGIKASVIVIDPPQTASASDSMGSERNVDITIQMKIPCTGS